MPLLLAGCASAPADRDAPHGPPAAAAQIGADPSYDWHGLVLMPFGSLLKDSPRPLHEVLLFHDESQGSTAGDPRECYTLDAPPRFVEHAPREYLLCFAHDRLDRIEASVTLAAAADSVFARACALWLQRATPTAGTDLLCAGRDGGIAFSARLDRSPAASDATLSLTLTAADAERPAAAASVP
jgi:hypothetical protein